MAEAAEREYEFRVHGDPSVYLGDTVESKDQLAPFKAGQSSMVRELLPGEGRPKTIPPVINKATIKMQMLHSC